MNIKSIFKNIYALNLLIAGFIVFVLVFAVLKWLSIYTHHGESVEIPNVKGLQIEEAAPFFTDKKLNYQVIDSIFDRSIPPGSIIESVPPIGTKVKEGRTIYITINSFTAQLIALPEVKDLSQRQAIAILQSVGFKRINVKSVPGAYRNLVLGIESRRQMLEAGDRISVNELLTLLVSSGVEEFVVPEDSVVFDESPEERWF